MGRLYRPHVPVDVRVLVAVHGCYIAGINPPCREEGESLSSLLARQLAALAAQLGCEVSDLRLDHDPPLAARPKHRRGLGKKTYYIPDANDPHHLNYRPHGPQFDGSHLIKTNVRGDHGQHPDRVLIKKQHRLENPGRAKKSGQKPTFRNPLSLGIGKQTSERSSRGCETPSTSSVFPKTPSRAKFGAPFSVKRKWPKRKFPKRSKT